MGGWMGGLRAGAQQFIAANALALAGHRVAPEQSWWDLPAKYRVSNEIADRLKAAHTGHNSHDDAVRHAEWSRDMAERIGPIWSGAAGVAHEAAGLLRGQPLSEAVMDLHNNAQGVEAGRAHRDFDPGDLQDRPQSLTAAYAAAGQAYEDVTPDRAFHGSRLAGQGTTERGYKDAPRYDPDARYPPYHSRRKTWFTFCS